MIAAGWRSLLYVPGDNARFLDRAQSRGADALILDLEDGVGPDCKDAARALVAERLPGLAAGPADLCVRVNGTLLELARDLPAAVAPGVAAVLLPKVEDAGTVRFVAEAMAEIEAERDIAAEIAIVALAESPAALPNLFSIATAHRRVAGMILGSEDFAAACGMTPSEEALRGAKQQLVHAARAAGIAPLGLLGSVADAMGEDVEGMATRSRACGFSGATAVHPGMVAALNRGFAPGEGDIAWAEAVVAAMDAARAEGRGAARVDGRMVDRPVEARARAILAQAKSLAHRAGVTGR